MCKVLKVGVYDAISILQQEFSFLSKLQAAHFDSWGNFMDFFSGHFNYLGGGCTAEVYACSNLAFRVSERDPAIMDGYDTFIREFVNDPEQKDAPLVKPLMHMEIERDPDEDGDIMNFMITVMPIYETTASIRFELCREDKHDEAAFQRMALHCIELVASRSYYASVNSSPFTHEDVIEVISNNTSKKQTKRIAEEFKELLLYARSLGDWLFEKQRQQMLLNDDLVQSHEIHVDIHNENIMYDNVNKRYIITDPLY